MDRSPIAAIDMVVKRKLYYVLGIKPGCQAHCIITTVTATVTHIPYLHKFKTAYT